jgi:hypothetical protein
LLNKIEGMTEESKGENLPGELPEVREPQGAASNDDSDEDSRSDDDEVADDGTGRAGEPIDELTRVRREKRLAMNRESARTRRKRKKILLESLEQQVADLNKRNQSYRIANENLKTKVTQLETDLGMARSTIAVLTQQPRTGAAELAPGRPLPQEEVLGANELNRQDHLRRLLQARSQLNSQRGPIPAATQLDLQSFEQASLQRERAILNALGHLDSNSCDSGQGMIEDAGRRNVSTACICNSALRDMVHVRLLIRFLPSFLLCRLLFVATYEYTVVYFLSTFRDSNSIWLPRVRNAP